MRKQIVIGNWKMHGNSHDIAILLQGIKNKLQHIQHTEVVVLPPYLFIEQAKQILAGTSISWGSQNMHEKPSGAFTGEISAGMLKEFGCCYVLLGHSERRRYFGETDKQVFAKYATALAADLMPVICVGETLAEREGGITEKVIAQQLHEFVTHNISGLQNAIIAYEPVWAIGTGKTATPEMAQAVHQYIRALIGDYNKEIAQGVRILYGGSLKRDNAATLFAMPDIDGGLIGGASLNAEEFTDIVESCNSY
jgi:triosephosphate isomerase